LPTTIFYFLEFYNPHKDDIVFVPLGIN